jgi:spermidine dehydrogenase
MPTKGITRRDFLNGIALGASAGGLLSPAEILADIGRAHPYPPELTGMRGSHDGSFEVAHGQARQGRTWPRPDSITDDEYDLVVVGGGISGLSAAFFWQQRAGFDARILVLDNHDDFGGHAKRNEFEVDGKRLIGYGGSQSIDTPSRYSAAASQLLRDIGVDVARFYDFFDQQFFSSRELSRGIYFSAERYGRDSVHRSLISPFDGKFTEDWRDVIGKYPLSEEALVELARLLDDPPDYLAGKSRADKIALMRRTSYSDYLRSIVGAHEDVVALLRDVLRGFWGVGFDAVSALEGARWRMPGTWHIDPADHSGGNSPRDEPYIFHFPDGNAGVARALVRRLVPDAVPGPDTMEGLVAARVDYGALDRRRNKTRIRLNSTAVDVRHAAEDRSVDVTYVVDGTARRVRGRHAILACYNNIVPHICPELPQQQVAAIRSATKIPLAYINVALRDWSSFAELGFHQFHVPQADLMHAFGLDFPVSMGKYRYAESPADPIVVHGSFVPTLPDQGLTEKEQHIVGQARMLEMTFAEFETQIIRQLSGALEGGGFDAERDIAAITVNRWPHGYAYEYNELYDPPEWSPDNGPHQVGARQVGRISIANSDASAYAYVNGAIDAAWRANRIQPWNRVAPPRQGPALEIGLDAAETLARDHA